MRDKPLYPWSLHALVYSCPSVGCLMDLCEENYAALSRLAPGLESMRGDHHSFGRGGVDLRLEILEQTKYTTLIHLTHTFPPERGGRTDPDAVLRVYHDASQAEIVELSQTVLPLERTFEHPSLERKWKANLFVAKWLEYCLVQGHEFVCDSVAEAVEA